MNQNNNLKDSGNSGISFDTDTTQPTQMTPFETSSIVSSLINSSGGLIKNEKQANYVLVGFVIIAVSISLFLVFNRDSRYDDVEIPIEKLSPKFDYER